MFGVALSEPPVFPCSVGLQFSIKLGQVSLSSDLYCWSWLLIMSGSMY